MRTPHNLENPQQFLQETEEVSVVTRQRHGKVTLYLACMKIKNVNMCVLGASHKQGLGPQNVLSKATPGEALMSLDCV